MLQGPLVVLLFAAQSSAPSIRPAPFPVPPTVSPPAPPTPPPDASWEAELPRLTFMPDLDSHYPPAARAEGRQGVAKLRCVLTTEGVLTECAIPESSGAADLDAAAFQIAARARYAPMRVSGRAVKASVILPVRWVLAE